MEKLQKYRNLLELKGLLREKEITYVKLAKYLEISLSAVANKMNGKTVFNLSEADKIGKMLDIKKEDMGRYFF